MDDHDTDRLLALAARHTAMMADAQAHGIIDTDSGLNMPAALSRAPNGPTVWMPPVDPPESGRRRTKRTDAELSAELERYLAEDPGLPLAAAAKKLRCRKERVERLPAWINRPIKRKPGGQRGAKTEAARAKALAELIGEQRTAIRAKRQFRRG